MAGPLTSLKVIEFSGLGPGPLAGQLLADLGADVIAVDRVTAAPDPTDINRRGKRSVALDLKLSQGRTIARHLLSDADILIEGFRPGVMEKLGLGPSDCPETLIYGRMTGWGQDGPLAQTAGHDINYLALSGVLSMIGPADLPPTPPLNLIGDYGGGTMFLLFGLLAAVIERGVSGKGQVVDAAMIDGVPAMMGLLHAFQARGIWEETRARNWLDGGAPFYRCYTCACGGVIAVGALEPQFFAELVEKAELDDDMKGQNDKRTWQSRTDHYAAVFARRSRADWMQIFDGSDACVAPVLSTREAADHPQNVARAVFADVDGVLQANPAPRFSRSVPADPKSPRGMGAETDAILGGLGYTAAEIGDMRDAGVLK
ncbi:MAG: CaiB/BaiF CoA-transferase family protein [Pseudomonadota bacterium]